MIPWQKSTSIVHGLLGQVAKGGRALLTANWLNRQITLRRLMGLALCFAGIAGSVLLAEDVMSAEPTTLLASSALSSASGPMSSSSYRINTSLAELGWIGRSQSPSYLIHMGAAWVADASTGGTVPPIPIPSVAVWGLAFLAASLAIAMITRRRRSTGGAVRHQFRSHTVLQ